MGAPVETLHTFEWHEMSVSGARATFDQLAKAEPGDGWLELRRGPLIELTSEWRVRTPTPAVRNAASMTSVKTVGGEEALVLFGGGVYPDTYYADTCVEINRCVRCARQFFTKSFLGDDAAVLARSSSEEPASPRHRAGIASMAWSTTR